MRVFLVIVLLVLILLGLAPFVDGYMFKNVLKEQLTAIANQNPHIKFVIEEYHLGWMSSHAKIRILPVNPPPAGANKLIKDAYNEGILIDDFISHGPLVYDNVKQKYTLAYADMQGNLHLPSQIESALLNGQTDQGIIQTDTIVTFHNEWIQQTKMPDITLPNIGVISWAGLNGDFTFDIKNNMIMRMDGSTVSGPASFTADANNPMAPNINVQPINYKVSIKRQTNGLWNGNNNLSLDGISVLPQTGSPWLSLISMNATDNFGVNANKLYDNSIQATIKELDIPNNVVPVISHMNLSIAVNNLNPDGLHDFLNYIRTNNPTEMTPQEEKDLQNLLAKIVTPSSTVNLDISFGTPSGVVYNKAKIYWQPKMPMSTFEQMVANVNAQMNIRVAVPLVAKFVEAYVTKQEAAVEASNAQIQMQSQMQDASTAVNLINDQGGVADLYKQQVANMLQQGMISLPDSLHLLGLENQHITAQDYAAEVKKMNLPPNIEAALIQAYTTQLAANTQPQTKAPAVVEAPSVKTQELIDGWVKQGILIKDKDDYIATLVFSNGVVTLNGKEINPAALMH